MYNKLTEEFKKSFAKQNDDGSPLNDKNFNHF